jgi:hypothetical protein
VLFPQEVRLSARAPDNHVAWFYEKSGLFSVRSAYHLAVRLDNSEGGQEGWSARADGSSPGFKRIWSANVPLKVQVFARRLSQEGLATQSNKMNRGLERIVRFAVRRMNLAIMRWFASPRRWHRDIMVWRLPDEGQLNFTGSYIC